MAQKRMFDRAIIETDSFLNISLSAKALYFLLGMECDDEGFVSPTRVLRLYGGEMGDIKNLVDVGLVIRFKNGVLVITDWNQNNYLDKNRIKPTQYQKEKEMLLLTEQGKYVFNNRLTNVQPEESRGEEYRVEEKLCMPLENSFDVFWEAYPNKELKKRSKEIWISKKLSNNLQEILLFIEKAKLTSRWKKGFIKQPPAFLNGECWNDNLEMYNRDFDKKIVSNVLSTSHTKTLADKMAEKALKNS